MAVSVAPAVLRCQGNAAMAINKPTGDNVRNGAVKKRSQTKTPMGDATT